MLPRSVNNFSLQHKGQCAAILRLLLDARGEWVALPKIMACAAQYNSRLWTLRHRMGFNIENRTECVDGVRHSWFRLVNSPVVSAPTKTETFKPPKTTLGSSGDWYEREHGPRPSTPRPNLEPLFAGVASE